MVVGTWSVRSKTGILANLVRSIMQLLNETQVRQTLFHVFDDDDSDLLEELAPVHSWDVMDQFPPYNSHDRDGSLVFRRLCAKAVSPPHEVHSAASPSMAPRYVFILFAARFLKEFLDWTPKLLTLHLQPLTTSKICLCYHFYTTIYSHLCGQCAKVFWCSYDRWGLAAFDTRDFFEWYSDFLWFTVSVVAALFSNL